MPRIGPWRTPPAATGPTYKDAVSRRPFRSLWTGSATARNSAPRAVAAEVRQDPTCRRWSVHDELASHMRPLGSGVLGYGRVEPRLRDVMIHRTCALCGAEPEWGYTPPVSPSHSASPTPSSSRLSTAAPKIRCVRRTRRQSSALPTSSTRQVLAGRNGTARHHCHLDSSLCLTSEDETILTSGKPTAAHFMTLEQVQRAPAGLVSSPR